jgi:DMSO/TMAO reductase YedYZ molybdopterin-dependent catalytic subunit
VAQSALAGLLAGGLTVGVAELLAALLVRFGVGNGQAGPVIAVGDAFVDRTPGWLKDFAIAQFGANDKPVLLASIGVVLVVLAVVAGLLARVRLAAGLAVVVLLGAVAAVAVVTRPSASPVDVLPTVIGAALGLYALQALVTKPVEQGRGWSRRVFLTGAGAVGAGAVLSGGLSRVATGSTTDVAASRAKVQLPEPVERVTLPEGTQLPVPGITPFVTANDAFYRVDTALTVPRLRAEEWQLRVHGMVGEEIVLTYADLLALPLVERMTTITCVSNEVGGKLAGNAVWLGYPLSDLMKMVAPSADADMVLSTSVDGMTISTPLANLTEGRDALLAVAMNGAPLPVEHGFPARMVVPGLYGYVSATKWVTDLKVTRFDRDEAYWTPRGYDAKAPIKMASRVDVPASFARLKAGRNAVAGVAWAQTKGIAKVQVRVDGGAWQDARLASVPGKNTWVQWVYEWDATPGNHTLQSRAIDTGGDVQVEERARIRPNGTTGLDSKVVQVT